MNKGQPDADILARYLAEECTDQERARVEIWIKASGENRQALEEFKKIWDSSAVPADTDNVFNTGGEWEKLNRKIEGSEAEPEPVSINYKDKQYPTDANWHKLLRVAAIFFVAGMIGLFVLQQWEPTSEDKQQAALREIATDAGQRVNLTLSDGTKVLVNAGSTLKIPEVFDAHKREVFLEGQAFFNVADNADKPFIIHTANALVQVLGTKFSLRAYRGDAQVTVAVQEGRVSFVPGGSAKMKETIVNGKEFARYNVETAQLQTQAMHDMGLYLGWVDGYLKFKEAPMGQVATELERRYGISVTFAEPEIKEQPLTAMLKSRSIRNVLDIISMSLKINYELNNDQVVFRK